MREGPPTAPNVSLSSVSNIYGYCGNSHLQIEQIFAGHAQEVREVLCNVMIFENVDQIMTSARGSCCNPSLHLLVLAAREGRFPTPQGRN